MILAAIDPWILTFSAATVIVTIWMGFWSARKSKTASDFFVAGRNVSVGWNASAISGEYLSAASFMGVAGMVMSSGYDALWYPVCYACGYLFLLLFIAGPLRRFGAYTIPDFAEGRYDSPVFRKIAVVFVLFIGFFYTMPQMKGAGTTLAYIFPGLPYWAGVVLVGAVITLNVALGGMKGITLVQAFQYWAKMFAISVPIFVLMAVYGHYGKQLGANRNIQHPTSNIQRSTNAAASVWNSQTAKLESRSFTNLAAVVLLKGLNGIDAVGVPSPEHGATEQQVSEWRAKQTSDTKPFDHDLKDASIQQLMGSYSSFSRRRVKYDRQVERCPDKFTFDTKSVATASGVIAAYNKLLEEKGILPVEINEVDVALLGEDSLEVLSPPPTASAFADSTPDTDSAVLQRLKAARDYGKDFTAPKSAPKIVFQSAKDFQFRRAIDAAFGRELRDCRTLLTGNSDSVLNMLAFFTGWKLVSADAWPRFQIEVVPDPKLSLPNVVVPRSEAVLAILDGMECAGARLLPLDDGRILIAKDAEFDRYVRAANELGWISWTRKALPEKAPADSTWLAPFGPLTTKAAKAANLSADEAKPYSLLYTYSLIIALVCGTAGLPHILVRFYTNPDGVAAKRTTMWVMILIGIFYVFPPVFGVMGRNLVPELYAGVGAKGTDKVVLELPKVLDRDRKSNNSVAAERQAGKGEKGKVGEVSSAPLPPVSSADSTATKPPRRIPWGSILSGITCAGAFAAFMSTFSGLLVSMTGALAHDVYGRMLRPKSTSDQRMKAFRFCAVIVGAVAILLGMQVEPFQINFMVGQAFAIAAASYFPLLFMSAWWRGMTMKGAAAGMLTGGLLALAGITLTSFSDLKWLPLDAFWAAHPLLRILCEQPAIWTVPLAITLMVVISKLTAREVPSDVRMKMLVLHAPEKLGLKQEYIQEHQHGH